MTKDFIYHELKDNLEHDLCPICTLISKNVDRFIEGLVGDKIKDTKFVHIKDTTFDKKH